MTIFCEEFDYIGEAILEPDMLVSPIEGFPRLGISCFSRKLQEAVLEKYGVLSVKGRSSSRGDANGRNIRYGS